MTPGPGVFVFILIFAALGVVYGLVLVKRGFVNLKTRRFVESMPVSTIRAMVLGPVEHRVLTIESAR